MAKGQDGLLLLKTAIKTTESNWAKRSQLGPESSWAWPILPRSQIGPRSQLGRNTYKESRNHFFASAYRRSHLAPFVIRCLVTKGRLKLETRRCDL